MSIHPPKDKTCSEREGDSPQRVRFRRVESLFRRARELGDAERHALLAAECPDDESIRAEVLEMVRADAQPAGALDAPPFGDAVDLARLASHGGSLDASRPIRMPARIGRFEILGIIGRGGMGVVYEAQQDEPRRAVALKVMQTGTSAARSLRRFRHEAHVLGRLQHPGIAQIFEAGVDDWGDGGQPYFAMELVRGRELIAYADEHGLGVRERLALLARICDAVHHAHQHGVIHRDLKPANILVVDGAIDTDGSGTDSATDGLSAQPKILDFGVARLLDPDATSTTMQTSAGQILGTVPYMSPEQAEGDPAAIDIRTDIYALGVISFELLAGRLPHDLHGKPLHEALRTLREHDAPRLGALDRRLRGDIETIVAKALEKESRRRFASAAEMAADFRRVLRDEPIQARRLGLGDQLWKFSRRHRSLVAATTFAALALVVATIVSVRYAVVAREAETEQRRLREVAMERATAAERAAYVATLGAAAASLRAHETAEATQRLELAQVERRGWEWHHLHSRLDDSMLVAPLEHASSVRLAIGPDPGSLFSVTGNGVVEHRSADDLSLRDRFTLPGSYVDRWATGLVAGADGRSIWICSRGGAFRVETASLEVDQVERSRYVHAIAPDGRHLVDEPRRDDRFTLRISRREDGATIAQGVPIEYAGATATFSRDGQLVAWSQRGGEGVVVVELASGRRILDRPDIRSAGRVCFSADSSQLAATTGDGTVHLLTLHGNRIDLALRDHQSAVTALDFAPDGSRLFTAARDGTVRVWRTVDGSIDRHLHGHRGAVNDLAAAPDGRSFISMSAADGTLRLWGAPLEDDPFVIRTPTSVYAVTFSPDGRRIAAATLGGAAPIRIWDRETLAPIASFGSGAASAIAYSEDGTRLAVGHAHADTVVLDARDGSILMSASRQHWRTDWVAFEPGDTTFLAFGNAASLLRHDAVTGEQVLRRRWPGGDSIVGARAALSPDRASIALVGAGEILLLDSATFETRARLVDADARSAAPSAVAFSPDGRLLASGGADRLLRIWDLDAFSDASAAHDSSEPEPSAPLHRLEGHTDRIYAITFSPDGQRIATGGEDRAVRIWDTETFDQLIQLNGHTGFVHALAWSPDGEMLVSGGGDATLRIWDTRPLRELLVRRRESAQRHRN